MVSSGLKVPAVSGALRNIFQPWCGVTSSAPPSLPHDESCPITGRPGRTCCAARAGLAVLSCWGLWGQVPAFPQTDWSHAQSRNEPCRLMGWGGTAGTGDGAEPRPSCPSSRVTKQRKQLTGTARSSGCAFGHHTPHVLQIWDLTLPSLFFCFEGIRNSWRTGVRARWERWSRRLGFFPLLKKDQEGK